MGVSALRSLVEPYTLMNNLLRDRRARREDNVEVGKVCLMVNQSSKNEASRRTLLDGDRSSDEDDDMEEMLPRLLDVCGTE